MADTFKMRLIDPEKFFVKFEEAIAKLGSLGVKRENIQMSISLLVKKNLLKSIETGYKAEGFDSLKIDENKFTAMGVSVPRHNYPYNDKILIYSNEASLNEGEVIEIVVDQILVD